MKRAGIITTLAMLVMALSASVALAAVSPATYSPTINAANAPSGTHLQSGTISCTVNTNLSISCSSYELSGVGNSDAVVSLTASYSATINCTNHGGNLVEAHTTTFSAGNTARLPPRRMGG